MMERFYRHIIYMVVTLLVCVSCQQGHHQLSSQNQDVNWTDSAYALYKQIERYANLDIQDSLVSETPRVLTFCREHEQWYWYYYTWCIMSETLTWNNRFDEAMTEAKNMHDDALKRHDGFGQALAYRVMALVYGVKGDLSMAVDYFHKALKTYPEESSFPPKIDIYTYLCSCLDELGKAQENDAALNEWKAYLDSKYQANTDSTRLPNFGNYYFLFFKTRYQFDLSQKDYAKAAVDLDSAEYYEALEGNQIKAVIQLLTLRGDLASVQNDYQQALAYNDRAIQLSDSAGLNISFHLNATATRIRIYEQQEDYKSAFLAFKTYAELKDSMIHADNQEQLNELNKRFEVDELKAQQELEKIAHERTFTRLMMMIAALVVLSLFVFTYYRHRAAKRLEVAYDALKIANMRAEEASRMKTNFIHQISHEIRTPLNILSGFTQIVTTPGMELDEQTKNEANEQIVENTNRITGLVNKMLELSDASSNVVIEREDKVPAIQIALQAVEDTRINASEGVTFTQSVAEDTNDLQLTTNVASATRALSLILDNAHKFLVKPNDPIKGSVTLRVVKAGSFVRYEVEDTGIGIPKAEAEHIFEEFVQLDENYNGTGIGLSVARSIARRLGGDVILDTYNSEQGSRFVMTLPCSKND